MIGRRDLPLLLWALVPKAALLLLVVMVGTRTIADERHVAPRQADTPNAVWILARAWDSDAYQGIALHGYTNDFSRNYPPGYPLLVRTALAITPNAQVAAVLVSNLAALLALLVFIRLARRMAPDEDLLPVVILFACTPGVLVWGTVAYTESTAILLGLLGWWAWLSATREAGAPRSVPRLLLGSLLFGAAVMVRHLAGATLLALGLIEAWRVLRAPAGTRGRALRESLAALAVVPLVAAYFAWKFTAHDLAGLERDIWAMGFSPLGGLPSLLELIDPELLPVLLLTLPLCALLIVGLVRLDGRLAVIAVITLLVALSFTGVAAQSINRYAWSCWPLAFGALRLRDRAAVWAIVGVLLLASAWCGIGHVRGTLAL